MRSLPSKWAALGGRALGRRVVVTDHGLTGSSWHGLLPKLFHAFLLVSAYSARELAAPAERTRLIYGGADPLRYAPDLSVQRAGVLFVGRLTPHKGIDRLIQALPVAAQLDVVGSTGHDPRPPERDYPRLLRQLARDRDVRFLGSLADEELARLYRSAAVLALPSVERTCYGRHVEVSELLGLVVLEAMASGTPVVASRIGGVSEIVQHGVTGFLVAPGDTLELGARLQQVLKDPTLARRMGNAAREIALERFTWAAVAQRCLAAYEPHGLTAA